MFLLYHNVTIHTMQSNEVARPIWMLLGGLTLLGGLSWLVNAYPPNSSFLLLLFFVLMASSLSLLFSFVLNNIGRGILLGGGVSIFFLLRLLGLRSPFYAILLFIVLVSLELTLRKR